MMSPSSALSNWLSGTSTFLLTPRMSVNWSLREVTSCFLLSQESHVLWSWLVETVKDGKRR